MGYTANDIRNICLLGHGGDGKSALCESMLFTTKAITRLGKRADGTTVSDFDDEEKKRQYSISTSVIPVEYNKCKINVLDNPGYFDFAGQIVQSLRVSDAGIICLTAKSGIGVGTEKGWKYLAKAGLPAMFYISKLDEEHANFFNVFDSLREMFGASVIPFTFPILKGEQAVGLVDLIEKKAYDANGKEIPMPAEAEEKIEEYMAELNEQVAETDEALMEKFFMEEPFTEEELLTGIKAGIRDRSVTPVFCGCAYTGLGTTNLLSNLVKFAPNPLEGKAMAQVDEEGSTKEFKLDPKGSPMVFVFNTLADQYGKNSYFKVISGDVEDTMSFVNVRTGDAEKLGNMFFPKGKDNTKTSKICCGDIGVFTKLASVKTGDTLGLAGKTVTIAPMKYDEPMYKMAIYAKVKGTEDKIAAGLVKLNEEDASFTYGNDPETKELIIAGAGDMQLSVLMAKLQSKYKVEAVLKPAKIAYRETIKKKVEIHGRHKKQSGGHGQFGDVFIRFEPCDSDELVFAEEVVGGSVPKNFFPAVEKGLRDSVTKGVLAGYPMVGLKATLYDGSYHPVDSSEMAFKTAASIAYKNGIPKADPVILEPIGTLKAYMPDEKMGDIMGDITKRRGRVLGMGPAEDKMQEIVAEVPMAEMGDFATTLRSVTHGRGHFSLEFTRYEEAPANVAEKVIEDAKAQEEE